MNYQHVPPGAESEGRPHLPPPPGWYADPTDARRLRLWDGLVWTDEVQNLPEYGPVPVAVRSTGAVRSLGFGPVAFIGVALAVVAMVFAVVVVASRLSGSGGEAAATAACRYFVKTRLTAPESAVFTSVEATRLHGRQWSVTGAVDSRSAGGTTEETRFTCTVSPGDDGWQLDRMRFDVP